MARKRIIFLILSIFASSVFAEKPINIPDYKLKACIEDTLGITNPTSTDMLKLKSLEGNYRYISNLTGLEYALNLEQLSMHQNDINDLSPIAGLTKLRELSIGYNYISDISMLPKLINLEVIAMYSNQVSDITPLADMNNLRLLELSCNPITDFSPIYNLKNLKHLSLSSIQCSDFSFIAGLTNLTNLTLGHDNLTDISFLVSLKNLRYLCISQNQISDISSLSELTNLYRIDMSNNQINDISPIAGLNNLTQLSISSNQINDISHLEGLTKLQMLELYDNQIIDISSLEKLKQLTVLIIMENHISDITPLGGLINLVYLDISSNEINNISSLAGLTNLTFLWLYNNQINDLSPLVELNKIENLNLQGNPLNADAYTIYIPSLESHGTNVLYDPLVWRKLSIGSTEGGIIVEPGAGDFNFTNGTTVNISSKENPGYAFISWSGSAVDVNKVANPDSAKTTVIMDANYTLIANFRKKRIITVDNDGPADFNNIQAAIDDANDGDTILIADGVYIVQDILIPEGNNIYYAAPNPIRINKSIIVKSEFGPENCIIEYWSPQVPLIYPSQSVVFSISGRENDSVFEGLTIKSDNIDGGSLGIYVSHCNSCIINNCIIKENGETGIFSYDCNSLIVTNCIIKENGASGIYSYDCNLIVNNCTIKENQGTGIYGYHCNSLTVTNCVIKENQEGLNIYGDNTLIENCIITGNVLPESDSNSYNLYNITYGGGVSLGGTDNDNKVLKNCVISGNKADLGAGVANHSGIPHIENCIIVDNISYKKQGNQIFAGHVGSMPNGGWLYHSNIILEYCCVEDDPNVFLGGVYASNFIKTDPCFVDPGYWDANDTPDEPNDDFWVQGDYHLKSQAGRFDPNYQTWVQDNVTSPCIDAGDPNSDWGEELWPHGKRINMGAYGGTAEASMSLSNIGDSRDLNHDDLVNWDDVLLFADKWNSNDAPLKQDLDKNGVVDTNDLVYFFGNWENDSNNVVPVFYVIDEQIASVGNELSFTVSAIDSDGDELVYIATGLPEGAEFKEQDFKWTPEQAGTYFVTFIVSDYKSLDYVTVQIIVF
jgi:internalin A